MNGDQHPARVALRQAREATIEQLSGSFARDELSLDEFEKRVDRAYAASSTQEYQALVSDLSVSQSALATTPGPASEYGNAITHTPNAALNRKAMPSLALAIFGNVQRGGRWPLAAKSRVQALFGNVELDLRSVVLPPGDTEIYVEAIFGNVELTLPPTIAVVCHGWSMFGSFQGVSRLPAQPDGTTVLHITGRSIFGNVEIHTLPSKRIDAPRLGPSRV